MAAAAAILSALAGCAGEATERGEEIDNRVPVEIAPLARGDLEIRADIVGVIAPWREVTIAPEISGTVQTLAVELGDEVLPGTTLFTLDQTDARLAVEEAEADLESARAALLEAEARHERISAMASDGVASDDALDVAIRALTQGRAAVRRAEANLRLRREMLRDCTLASPITGEVTRRMVELGTYLTAGVPALDLAQIDPVKLAIEVSESERIHLSVGEEVPVHIDRLPGQRYAGRIHALGAAADRETLTFPVEIAIPNAERTLLPGMIARADLLLERREGALLAPLAARVATLAGAGVFAAVATAEGEMIARFVPVEFGQRTASQIEILSGAEEGLRVVTTGTEALRDGTPIRLRTGR